MKISTKKGDFLFTDLKNRRVRKDDKIIVALGLIDETIVSVLEADCFIDIPYIKEIVKTLSGIAGYISGYQEVFDISFLLTKLEKEIEDCPETFKFNYPYKQQDRIAISKARAKVRSLERALVAINEDEVFYLSFINRLSDFMYCLQVKCK
ncbi:MAG: ATP:cob(I)alamin adenosyltransferase [Bacillota bacterium]|nr:ATP:cob(I)alamin adenosyltransferase [Bacillota bacterium]NLL27111.1 ATP:cob(I)alamin adenosyltransferase [Erysipelotrichia bacterium]